jgi:aldehyde dehydrogenase (NAD+)
MNQFQEIFDKQLANFNTDVTKTYEWRIDQLDRMEKMILENTDAFNEAIGKDFKSSYAEQYFETGAPLGTIAGTKANLKEWMKPKEEPIPQFLRETGHKGLVYREPFGVTLVIGPFNGPLLLSLRPAINCLAAGNPVILKTSNALPKTSEQLIKLIPKYFELESVAVVSGNRDAITELLKLPFSFIFFTGSVPTGKVIMRAAAENLTPVILELGGQNPVIVDETADIADAAEKIAWGKSAWGGQWCTSPGYVLVHESVADKFAEEAKKALKEMYGDDPKKSADYSRIVSAKELQKLTAVIDPAKVIAGGDSDLEERYLAPTLVYPVTWDDNIMKGENFGPVLPILKYSNLKDAVKKIKNIPKPLSAYFFSKNDDTIKYLLNTLSFGGGAVNQVNITLYIETMPFGGVGESGIGCYYGKYGFDSLTHPKSILFEPSGQKIDHLIPPYNMEKIKFLNNWGVF